MAFITPEFGLNKDLDSLIITPITDLETDGVKQLLYAEDVDGVRDPRFYEENISRDYIILKDGVNEKIVLLSNGLIIQGDAIEIAAELKNR
jgi:hypothetical protein